MSLPNGSYDLEYPIGITCDSFVTLELTVLPPDDPLCTVNTSDQETTLNLRLYPNPVTDMLHIQGNIPLKSQLLDLEGRLLLETKENKLDLSNYSDGVYLLKVTDGFKSEVHRVVKM